MTIQSYETRIGTLTLTHDFANGYPADETYEKLFDEMDFQPPMMNFFAGIRLMPADRAARMALLEKTAICPYSEKGNPQPRDYITLEGPSLWRCQHVWRPLPNARRGRLTKDGLKYN